MGWLVHRLVGEDALRVGHSFVEKRGKQGGAGGSVEESGGSAGESRAKVRRLAQRTKPCCSMNYA